MRFRQGGKATHLLVFRSLQFCMVELLKMSHPQGNDHLSYQWCPYHWHTCLVHPTLTWTFTPFGKWEIWAHPTLIAKEQIQSVSLWLCMPKSSVLVSWGNNAWIEQCSIIQKWRLALHFHPKGHFAYSSGPWCGWGNISQVVAWASTLDGLW